MSLAPSTALQDGVLPSESFMARFWARVDQSAGPEACWPWTGACSKKMGNRYGHIRLGGRGTPMIGAHRVALFLHTGIAGAGLDACHRDGCTTTLCVNWRHLYWATHRTNIADNDRRYGRVNGKFGRRR